MKGTVTAASTLGANLCLRGIVGVVDVPGVIRVGDEVTVEVFEAPVIERS